MLELAPILGHRGASAYAPENTLVAFELAREMGLRWVEFDVMLSSDGIPFVIHDTRLSRTTNGRGQVGQVTSDYLRSLDAGSWFGEAFAGAAVPSLEQVFAWMAATGMKANLEIKPYPGTTELTTLTIVRMIAEDWPELRKQLLISSFDVEALVLSQLLAPEIPRGFLMHRWQDKAVKLASELACCSVHLNQTLAKPARLESLKQQGFALCVYTVDEPKLARDLFALGVDAVFSNYPDLLSKKT